MDLLIEFDSKEILRRAETEAAQNWINTLKRTELEALEVMEDTTIVDAIMEGDSLLMKKAETERLDEHFFQFLSAVCSDKDAADEDGDRIHVTMAPVAMNTINNPECFMDFKLKTKAFTNAFIQHIACHQKMNQMVKDKIKAFLGCHRYIQKFNADGKRIKMKGCWIWTVRAGKTDSDIWTFSEFEPVLIGDEAFRIPMGSHFQYRPSISDPCLKGIYHPISLNSSLIKTKSCTFPIFKSMASSLA